jgi:hypothetical protein
MLLSSVAISGSFLSDVTNDVIFIEPTDVSGCIALVNCDTLSEISGIAFKLSAAVLSFAS